MTTGGADMFDPSSISMGANHDFQQWEAKKLCLDQIRSFLLSIDSPRGATIKGHCTVLQIKIIERSAKEDVLILGRRTWRTRSLHQAQSSAQPSDTALVHLQTTRVDLASVEEMKEGAATWERMQGCGLLHA